MRIQSALWHLPRRPAAAFSRASCFRSAGTASSRSTITASASEASALGSSSDWCLGTSRVAPRPRHLGDSRRDELVELWRPERRAPRRPRGCARRSPGRPADLPGSPESRNSTFCIRIGPSSASSTDATVPSARVLRVGHHVPHVVDRRDRGLAPPRMPRHLVAVAPGDPLGRPPRRARRRARPARRRSRTTARRRTRAGRPAASPARRCSATASTPPASARRRCGRCCAARC